MGTRLLAGKSYWICSLSAFNPLETQDQDSGLIISTVNHGACSWL
jgi:hypothetical protein